VYQLNKDFINNHGFSKSGVIFKEDEPLINITFDTKRLKRQAAYFSTNTIGNNQNIPMHDVSGELLISLLDFSIHGFSYAMYDISKETPLFSVKIEYRKENGNMYLNYISFNNRFEVSEREIFGYTNIVFDKQEKFFEVTFNSAVNPETLKERNFKIKFNNSRVVVSSISLKNPETIIVKINDFKGEFNNISRANLGNLSFRINGLRDVKGREIRIPETETVYQFREFFVQEVFTNRPIDETLNYILKNKPLQEAGNNNSLDKDKYIINSPLIKQKME
jgi:hypothetical protein